MTRVGVLGTGRMGSAFAKALARDRHEVLLWNRTLDRCYALAGMVPRAAEAAERLAADHGISAEVVDLRTLVPLDVATILESVEKTSRLFTVEENPRLCGWGAEIVSIVADEGFWSLDAPLVRITTPHVPLASAPALEDLAMPSVDRIADTVRRKLDEAR